MPTPSTGIAEAVRAHLARVFPKRELTRAALPRAGLVVNLPELAVFEVAPPPGEPHAPWLYVSGGASAEPMDDGYGLEFLLCAPARGLEAAKLVAMVANLHADPRYPLSLGQVLEIGHSWLPGASADHLVVALPAVFDPELEWLSDRTATARFIWLLPITSSEAAFAKQRGLEALQSRLGAAQADVAALVRESVV
ncbi:MAG TPA: suppressor of fused domain protein [Myxococcota bacterium]|nr:suppressor of fused domain protein [Myxococcota bacterium]